jgi:hypothetical protein
MFWFVILILTNSYTADLTARLGAGTISYHVTDETDLDGRDAGIDKEYAGVGKEYGATETFYDEHNEIDKMT